jgi:alkylated DNA repair dioxygenase AlkB
MLDHLLHRELSNSLHINNLSQDYTIPYPSAPAGSLPPSFFKYPQSHESQTFHPTNPLSTHKALNTAQFLQKKLRWLTLGSQYDWSTRSYATTSLTSFPPDIAKLVTTLFRASFVPESGVVLLYSPKDYMPVHRDVSEESPRGLASFTLGCDGLFVIAKEEAAEQNVGPRDRSKAAPHDPRPQDSTKSDTKPQPMIVIRVRSGDVVQMGGPTRWAWHAMPKVMAGTCPKALQKWPVKDDGGTPREYERWKGYMRGKRLNISCRQVWESSDEASNDSANSNP